MHPKLLLAGAYRTLFLGPPAPQTDPLILWLIPMVGRANAGDWERACAVLAETLASIEAVRYANWKVLLCSQDRPEGFVDGPRHQFVQAPPQDMSKGISDQNIKARLLAEHAARTCKGFTYVSHLDADDLIHPDLPGWIAADNNGSGYLVEKGYMLDASSGRLARMGTGTGEMAFWTHCGSSGYFAVDFGRQKFPAFHLRLIGKGHKNYIGRSARLGRPLSLIPFPAMMYLVNHGENMQSRRGHDKLLYLAQNEVTDPAEAAAIYAEFGLRLRKEAGKGGVIEVIRG
ncbi:glycosyltransferase family A protein [Frigidibacter sp.]|uniref:glycosyltransferase family A protein n=1 Tax=Frigidibacter sp. TaxID=2586418 RepID=UPI0027370589|nr:glycosyltransferase family A protein [Frigidibacter sp.]MDP3339623.1 glycosyltransferase family A protein [Frigidibacter sp.]